jgi:hypothetical protein
MKNQICHQRITSRIPLLEKALENSLAPFRFLTPFSIRSSWRLRNSPGSGLAIGKRYFPSSSPYGIPYDKA